MGNELQRNEMPHTQHPTEINIFLYAEQHSAQTSPHAPFSDPYLGVEIADDLKWSTHISNITKKANSKLGFLKRNLRNCPTSCVCSAYKSLIRSTLEYGAVIWNPYMQKDIDNLERIQHVAARFRTKDYDSRELGCVTRMLEKLELHVPPTKN